MSVAERIEAVRAAPSGSRLWMYILPGITDEIIMQAAKTVGILPYSQLTGISNRQWDELRAECLRRARSRV